MKALMIMVATIVGIVGGFGSLGAARADVLASGVASTSCATVYNNRLQINACDNGDAQNWFTGSYGQQHYHNLCLDTDGVSVGSPLIVTTCQDKQSQRWALQPNGQYRNETSRCADLLGAHTNYGTLLVMRDCDAKARSQVWLRGRFAPMTSVVPAAVITRITPTQRAGAVYNSVGQLVAIALVNTNGSNIVAQGGGNIVAQGGGNIVAQGGGNVIVPNGGAIVAQGGGN